MENFPSGWNLKRLVEELSQGKELAKQLQMHLSSSPSSSSHEVLIDGILYSYDQAISILINGGNIPLPDSPLGSPRSDDSDQEVKDQASKERKAVARWIQKVKVWPGIGIEEQFEDGYGWRKYGQKDILGAKHPRGYYRCTHRHNQGCLATKQVQRSDDDPTIFEVTYRRKHTCNAHAHPTNKNTYIFNNNPPIAMPDPPNHEGPDPLTQNPQQIEPLFNIQTSLKVVPQDLGTNENLQPSFNDLFNFPSSSRIEHGNNSIFSDVMGGYPDSLLPNLHTSGSNYFPISTGSMDDNYGGFIPNLDTLDSELSQIVAHITSAADTPAPGTPF